jgi:hypothetical protein
VKIVVAGVDGNLGNSASLRSLNQVSLSQSATINCQLDDSGAEQASRREKSDLPSRVNGKNQIWNLQLSSGKLKYSNWHAVMGYRKSSD